MLRYETAAGVGIILDDYLEQRTVWELFGRTGFAAPPLEYTDEAYAAGYTETIACRVLPRDVTIPLVIRGKTQAERDGVLRRIAERVLQHGVRHDWGRLVFTRSDGKEAYLHCVYAGGLEAIADDEPFVYKAVVNFHASDPYFYALDETNLILSDAGAAGLYFGAFWFGAGTYFRGGSVSAVGEVVNDGQTVYPEILITGPAKAIRIRGLDSGAAIAFPSSFELQRGEQIRIDCRDRRRGVWLTRADGAVSDITPILTLESSLIFPIHNGLNRFQLDYVDTTDATRFLLRYRERGFSA